MAIYSKKKTSNPSTLVRLDAVLEFPSERKTLAYYKSMQNKGIKGGLWRLFTGESKKLN